MASGLYYYLRTFCDSQATWGVNNTVNNTGNNINIPNPMPMPAKLIRQVKTVPYSYNMNVCTVSYSMAWWNWTRWERELDWMALHGINFPLSFAGTLLCRCCVNFPLCMSRISNFPTTAPFSTQDDEILKYFSGAAFLAWQRMGNIRGWGGPLDADWREVGARLCTLPFAPFARKWSANSFTGRCIVFLMCRLKRTCSSRFSSARRNSA